MSPVRRFFVPVKGLAGPCRQRGLTLIELMVALVIGLLVTAAMLKVYVDASRMYRFNEGLARVQENGRFAIEFIRRDARVAGFWGCNTDAVISSIIDGGIDYTGTYVEGTDGSSDTITFYGATGSGLPLNANMESTDDEVPVKSASGFEVGDAVLVSDCERGDIFELSGKTGTAPNVKLGHSAGANTSPNLSKLFADDSVVHAARQTIFSIQDDPDSEVPTLYREVNGNSQPLVEGIESMQVLYGEDTDEAADGTANRYVRWSDNADELNPNRIVSVRVSLLVRSINSNLTTTPSQITYNGAPYPTTPDRYLRKVFTSTITLRNKTG